MRTSTLRKPKAVAKPDKVGENEKRCPSHQTNFPDESPLRPIGDYSKKGTYCRRCNSIRNKARNAAARVGAEAGEPIGRRTTSVKRKPAVRRMEFDGVLPLGDDPLIDLPIMTTELVDSYTPDGRHDMLFVGTLLAFKQYWFENKYYCVMATHYKDRGDYRTDFYRVPFGSFRSVSPDELDAMGYADEAEHIRSTGEPTESTEGSVSEPEEFGAEGPQVELGSDEPEAEVSDDLAEESDEESDEEAEEPSE